MKRGLFGLGLALAVFGAHAQVHQTIHLVSEGLDRTSSSTAYGALEDHGTKTGTDIWGGRFETQAWASSTVAPGAVTTSVYASFDGRGGVWATSFAGFYDTIRIETKEARDWLTVRYSVALTTGNTLSIDPVLGGGTTIAGHAYWGATPLFGNGATKFGSTSMDYSGKPTSYMDNQPSSGGLVDGVYTFEARVLSHENTLVEFFLSSQIFLNSYQMDTQGEGGSLVTQSMYWAGISSVTRADGSAVAYSLSSQSGTDYARSFVPTSAVPEPSGVMMAVAGLGLIAFVTRKRNNAAMA